MSNLHTVAVYGTLKQGFGNHRLLQHVECAGEGVVSGHRLFQSGIPFLVKDKSSDYDVKVELYEVDDQTLASLDRLEGHPSAYCREVLGVKTDKDIVQAWTYLYPTPVGVENKTGVF